MSRMKLWWFVGGLAIVLRANAVFSVPRVIFDTDMYTDFDDAGALACLHALADAGECEILATVANTRDCMSVAMCEIINAYYGRPDIPVGCVRGIGVGREERALHEKRFGATVRKYAKWVRHGNSSDAPDAAEVYRKVLSAQPDKSVVICSVGFLSNLRKLMETDRDLVARKVRLWVAMACFYPKGRECNSMMDWESSKIAFENWPTPIVFSDFQYGMDCFAGRAIAESDVKDSPVADVFRGNMPSRDEIAKDAGGHLRSCNGFNGRAAWDETAVLAAVRGVDSCFNVHRGTYRMVGTEGEDEWVPDEKGGRHMRLTEKTSKVEVGRMIDELICRGPRQKVTVTVDFADERGPVKPVNGVGQPPILGLDGTNMFHYLREAGIPYSRLHDVGGYFGGNVFVDIPNLFRDFEADETRAENYDFHYTDLLLKALVENGVEPYFRLGVTIENAAGRGQKAYRIFPPKDFAKWARICEHVIRHYTEGWADGFRMRISHWEIWNEPENIEPIAENPMWKAPFEEYIRLYLTVAPYLKEKFPHLKIGGYGGCGFYAVGTSWPLPEMASRHAYLMKSFTDFLAAVRAANAPLDFFSFHCYDRPAFAGKQIAHCRKTLDEYGFKATEMSLNEWLPCNGGADISELDTPLQAAQVAAMLTLMQNGPVDDAEIYDARAVGGAYAPFFVPETHRPRKAYHVYCAFNELRKLGTAIAPPSLPDGLWACGATDGKGRAALLVANTSDAAVALDFCTAGWRMESVRDVLSEADAVGHAPLQIQANDVRFIRFGLPQRNAETR